MKSIESSTKNSASKNKGFKQIRNLLRCDEKFPTDRMSDRMEENIALFG